MASLLELVERVNKGELIDPQQLEVYQDSTNAAEKFLANHAHAMLDLRRSHTYLLEALEAIDYADQKVLFQFLSVLGFLGLNDQRCEPVIRFGRAAINRKEIGLAMEAIQSGILQDNQHNGHYSRDRDNAKTIAAHYDHCGDAIGWNAPGPLDWQNPVFKIGYVTTTIVDDEAPARLINGLSKHLDPKRTKLHVYSTEATVRREKQSFGQGPFLPGSSKRGKETIDTLGRRKAGLWFTPLDQDLAGGAKELANQIFKDQIDVLIIDAQLNDPIAAVLSGWTPAKSKLHIVRRSPVLSGESDGAIYFDHHRFHADEPHWQASKTHANLLCEGVEPLVLDTPVPPRSTFGIPDSATLLTTLIQDGDEPLSHDFLDAIVHTLRQHTSAVLLVAGDGDTGPLKRRLEAAGLSKRGGFVGKRKDLTDFFRMSDLYLAPFHKGTPTGILAAMAAGRAIVALAGESADPHRPQALIGEENSSHTPSAFADRADKLIRDAALRTKLGDSLKQRITGTFSMDRTAHALEALCRQLLQPVHQDRATHAQAA